MGLCAQPAAAAKCRAPKGYSVLKETKGVHIYADQPAELDGEINPLARIVGCADRYRNRHRLWTNRFTDIEYAVVGDLKDIKLRRRSVVLKIESCIGRKLEIRRGRIWVSLRTGRIYKRGKKRATGRSCA